jgi:ABC-type dipeptide/oligopeptide/nickel transport system permease subunit
MASAAWLVLAGLAALMAPVLTATGPLAADPARALLPPAAGHLFGTDALGRDVLTRLVWGGRWTFRMGLIGLGLGVGLGLPVGLVAGALGGMLDQVSMRLVDALLAFPGLLLAMSAIALLGAGLNQVSLAVGLAAFPAYARLARSAALEVRAQPYIDAARSVGASEWRILLRHVLPNAAAPLLAFAVVQLGWVLLNGAALNFLGLGVAPGTPEWGAMLAEGRGYLRDAPWISTVPGIALTTTVLAANLIGDGIQETLRPH